MSRLLLARVCSCVIPVVMQSRSDMSFQLPFGLRSLKPINVSQVINGRSLADCCRSDRRWRPRRSDVDALFLNNMTLMLNDRLYLKLQREERQQKELSEWIEQERMRRLIEMERESAERERRRLQREYDQHREQLDKHVSTAQVLHCRLSSFQFKNLKN